MTIFIRDLKLFAHHGVLPQERAVGAYFILNIGIEADVRAAVQSDDVADTISYADVLAVVRREMSVPSALLEHVAGRVAQAIFDAFPLAETVDIDILKQNPPMGADCAGAGIRIKVGR